ncbi:endonuclease/exonuclease/phosphatase family protein [Kitasatospora aureofaciens]|uniref:endonuclease/exonuclease/phosphatase family protein n=1 Tax=Kitasatospora aureofaciens TaxID=1894 RepID=UPI0033CCED79
MVRIANFNAYKLKLTDRDTDGWRARVTAIQEVAPDILTLQEVLVDEELKEGETELDRAQRWRAEASEIIGYLAADCGLSATTIRADGTPGGIAMANNADRGWYTAILWNPDTVHATRGGFRPFGAPDFWHGCTTMLLDVGAAEPVLVASYHGDPFRPDFRANEALRLKGIFRRTGGAKPGILAGDFNAISAATTIPGGTQFYDPEPYHDQDHDDLEYQLQPGTAGGTQLADRRQTAALLRAGYMVDAAAHLAAPWQPTVGYWADGQGDPDPWGERRIDLILATRPVAPALVRYRAHVSPASEAAADHRPVYADLDVSAIAAPQEAR